jgi:ELWxxDGT repeat protein
MTGGTAGPPNAYAFAVTSARRAPVGLRQFPSDDKPMPDNLVLFRANTGIDTGLWVSDGTSAGTWRLNDNAVTFIANFTYPSFTPLGDKDLFGTLNGLFVTDGTSSGTSELSVAGTFVDFQPENLLRLGSEVLFTGLDANQKDGLWVTDGTSAGTSELSVAGAGTAFGIDFGSGGAMTVFGSEALFAGFDDQGKHGLWITDGTALGTSEIPVGGSFQNGNIFGGGFIPGFRFATLRHFGRHH